MKYIKRPVVIEAFQYDGNLITENIPDWANKAYEDGILYYAEDSTELYIKTLEGDMYCPIGNFIIQGVNGELYSCSPDVFAKTYKEDDGIMDTAEMYIAAQESDDTYYAGKDTIYSRKYGLVYSDGTEVDICDFKYEQPERMKSAFDYLMSLSWNKYEKPVMTVEEAEDKYDIEILS